MWGDEFQKNCRIKKKKSVFLLDFISNFFMLLLHHRPLGAIGKFKALPWYEQSCCNCDLNRAEFFVYFLVYLLYPINFQYIFFFLFGHHWPAVRALFYAQSQQHQGKYKSPAKIYATTKNKKVINTQVNLTWIWVKWFEVNWLKIGNTKAWHCYNSKNKEAN